MTTAKGDTGGTQGQPRRTRPIDDTDGLLDDLRSLLSEVNAWFRITDSSAVPNLKCSVSWELLNSATERLADRVRVKKSILPKHWYSVVNRKWKSLKLVQTIREAAKRACRNIPLRPMHTLFSLREAGGAMASIANELPQVYAGMAQGEPPPVDFDWCKFEPVLLAYQNLGRDLKRPLSAVALHTKDSAASRNLIAYAAFLQAALDDAFWLVRYHRPYLQLHSILEKTIMDEELVKKLAAHVGFPASKETQKLYEELNEVRRKSLDKQRQKRKRSKKAGTKNVT